MATVCPGQGPVTCGVNLGKGRKGRNDRHKQHTRTDTYTENTHARAHTSHKFNTHLHAVLSLCATQQAVLSPHSHPQAPWQATQGWPWPWSCASAYSFPHRRC